MDSKQWYLWQMSFTGEAAFLFQGRSHLIQTNTYPSEEMPSSTKQNEVLMAWMKQLEERLRENVGSQWNGGT